MRIKQLQATSYKLQARSRFGRGFTLPEVLVSVAIFSVVAVVAISSVISTAELARRTQAQRSLIDNLDFALENFSRRVRVSSNYLCYSTPPAEAPVEGTPGANCQGDGGRAIALLSPNDTKGQPPVEVMYSFKTVGEKGALFYKVRGQPESRLTAQNVSIDVEKSKFYVSGVGADQKQPRVLLVIRGSVPGKGGQAIPFDIQTTISQRKLED